MKRPGRVGWRVNTLGSGSGGPKTRPDPCPSLDVVFKASKDIDWEGMTKLLISDAAHKEFVVPHRTFDDVNSTLQTKFSQESRPIDWKYYRKRNRLTLGGYIYI
ncbi:hypothetical protein GQ457_02G024830 [Hibiscus cannabinus]